MHFLEQHFELLTRENGNAARLKELILQLAVQGKLVEQDPDDEPADKLLERIQAEKEKLIKEGKIRKEKPLPKITENEIPFKLPEGWVWCRLSESVDVRDGTHDTPKYCDEGIPLVTSKNLKNRRLDFENIKFISLDDHKIISQRSKVDEGDILLAMIGTIGNSVIVESIEIEFSIKNVALFKFYDPDLIFNKYLRIYLDSAESEMVRMAGGGVQKFVSLNFLRKTLFPLPPTNEQKRIVARVESLLGSVEELDKANKKAGQQKKELGKSMLHHLTQAQNHEETQQYWTLIENNFENVFNDTDNIKELRKTCLQLAVQGKLVKQDPTDEPASILLEKIKAEKERLIRDGKIKKEKPLPEIKEEEVPFVLPEGWEWCRLGEIGLANPKNEAPDDQLASFIPMKMVSEEYGINPMFEDRKWKEIKRGFTHFANDDVVIAKITPCFQNSKVGVIKGLKSGIGAGTTELHVFRKFGDTIDPNYVYLFFKSPMFLEEGVKQMTGTAGQQRVPKDYVFNSPVPLPPLNEQKRIVEKVDRLMALCDRLEERVKRSEELVEGMMEGVISQKT
ncbi:MAG: restriction endonuclease subunit S [Bacteroidales bacterium]